MTLRQLPLQVLVFYLVTTIPPMLHTRPVPAFFLTKGQEVEAWELSNKRCTSTLCQFSNFQHLTKCCCTSGIFFFFFLLKSCSILSGCRAILGSRIYQFYCIYIMLVWRRFWISKLHYRITEVCLIFVPKGTSIHSFYGWGSTYVVSSCRRFYRITSLLSPLRLILLSVSTGVMLSP